MPQLWLLFLTEFVEGWPFLQSTGAPYRPLQETHKQREQLNLGSRVLQSFPGDSNVALELKNTPLQRRAGRGKNSSEAEVWLC